MRFVTDYRLENFILNTRWDKLPSEVRERMKGCLIDLVGALVVGSLSEQFRVGIRLAERLYGSGEVAVVGSQKRLSFMGAATAMGHSSNAYDIDDGHNIIRAHPGTSFIGALLAAAYERDLSLSELMCAMLVSYEATVRSGAAIMDYYGFAHSSGTFGAVGTAVGVGRIFGFTKEQLNNAISVAEFNAPLVPGIRSVEYPSMNKDGVPFGVMVGLLAVMETLSGFEGNKNLLEADEYRHYLDGLGEKFEVMSLYFKPYPCCRWAHPAIDAVVGVMKKENITYTDVEKVIVKTFKRATMLSAGEPKTADEAQYNIAYPVAASVVYGDFGIERVMPEAFCDERVLSVMRRLEFEVDAELDALFPEKRFCRAEILTFDGRRLVSERCEPRGEAHENIGVDWLSDKLRRMTASILSKEKQEALISMIASDENASVRDMVDLINS